MSHSHLDKIAMTISGTFLTCNFFKEFYNVDNFDNFSGAHRVLRRDGSKCTVAITFIVKSIYIIATYAVARYS